jgi:hypothetical protein
MRAKNKAKSITINITKEILEESVSADSSKCMIAQALRLKGASSVNVTAESVSFNMDETRFTYPLPARVAVKFLKFDESKNSIRPFSFQLQSQLAFSRPVIKCPNRTKRGPTKIGHAYKRSKRRFHGLRVLEAREEA